MERSGSKSFVIDTNVVMHDPTAIFRFAEHDVYLPIVVLEELDRAKRGLSEVARNVRHVSRLLDELVAKANGDISGGITLPARPDQQPGHLYFYMDAVRSPLPNGMAPDTTDNILLGITHDLAKHHPDKQAVLVTKDITLRIKAHALGIAAEDYTNDRVLDDANLLYRGMETLEDDFWEKYGEDLASWQDDHGRTFYEVTGPSPSSWHHNQFLYTDSGTPFEAVIRKIDGNKANIEVVKDYTTEKNKVWGISARNREQNFALNLLMDPDIDFVSLLGHAGTGKTLLTLAAALTQTLEHKYYTEIIVTRITVPVGDDIGYLPGTEREKMEPWMGALEDNLDVLHNMGGSEHSSWGRAATFDLLRSRIRIKSLNFMRGRTFLNKFIIIDEAQNLSPHQIKTLITRAGPGSKVVCLGNIAQIDTPYLTETTSGLTYAVDRFKYWEHSGHITLQRGERSRLADYANEIL